MTLEAVEACARKVAALTHPVSAAKRRHGGGDRPRIGFLSGDFACHAVGRLAIPAVEQLHKLGYDLTCYATTLRSDTIDILIDLAGYTSNNRFPLLARRAAPLQLSWIGYPATTGLANLDYILRRDISRRRASRR